MFSANFEGLMAPESAEHFAQSMGAICADVGADRFMVLQLNGATRVKRLNVAQVFHSGAPSLEAAIKAPAGRLAVDQFLAKLTDGAAPTMMLAPGVLAIDGFEHGCAVMLRGERFSCVVVFATTGSSASIMDMMAAANVAAQCALVWFATLPAKDCPLSDRELQCLLYYSASFGSEQTGQALQISAKTVDGHLARARLRCGVSSTLAAVMLAIDEGWIQPSEIRRLEAAG